MRLKVLFFIIFGLAWQLCVADVSSDFFLPEESVTTEAEFEVPELDYPVKISSEHRHTPPEGVKDNTDVLKKKTEKSPMYFLKFMTGTKPRKYLVPVEEGVSFTFPVAPVRPGYTFLYWEPSGRSHNGLEYHYQPGETLIAGGDLKFNAVWQEKTDISGAIELVVAGKFYGTLTISGKVSAMQLREFHNVLLVRQKDWFGLHCGYLALDFSDAQLDGIWPVEALQSCYLPYKVLFPRRLSGIEPGALEGCKKLKKLGLPFLPEPLKKLCGGEVPKSLHTVTLYNTDRLPDEAFYGCKQLRRIEFESSMLYFGNLAFAECGTLSIVYPFPKPPDLGDSVFLNTEYCLDAGTVDAARHLEKGNVFVDGKIYGGLAGILLDGGTKTLARLLEFPVYSWGQNYRMLGISLFLLILLILIFLIEMLSILKKRFRGIALIFSFILAIGGYYGLTFVIPDSISQSKMAFIQPLLVLLSLLFVLIGMIICRSKEGSSFFRVKTSWQSWKDKQKERKNRKKFHYDEDVPDWSTRPCEPQEHEEGDFSSVSGDSAFYGNQNDFTREQNAPVQLGEGLKTWIVHFWESIKRKFRK